MVMMMVDLWFIQNNRTALFYACQRQQNACAIFLAEHGAFVDIVDSVS